MSDVRRNEKVMVDAKTAEDMEATDPNPLGLPNLGWPNPGIHYDIPEAEYRALDALCQSDLKLIADNPAQYKWQQDHPKASTPAQVFGTMVHVSVLEPEKFDSLYVVADKPDLRLKGNKAAWQEQQDLATSKGKTIVSTDDYDTLTGMREAVRKHPDAGKLLTTGRREVSIVWVDEASGQLCKGRIDWLDGNRIVDLKTCQSAHPRAFLRAVMQYGYHVQQAFYTAGLGRFICGLPPTFTIVAVEKHPPFHVVVYDLGLEMDLKGESEWMHGIARYMECQASGYWPSYVEGIQTLELPEWAKGIEADDDEPAW